MALLRKKEVEDLIAALHKEQSAARSNLENLLTIERAVEARLSEAEAKLANWSRLSRLLRQFRHPGGIPRRLGVVEQAEYGTPAADRCRTGNLRRTAGLILAGLQIHPLSSGRIIVP